MIKHERHTECVNCKPRKASKKAVLAAHKKASRDIEQFHVQVGDMMYIKNYGTYVVSWCRLPNLGLHLGGGLSLRMFSIVNTLTGHTFVDPYVNIPCSSVDLRQMFGGDSRRLAFEGGEITGTKGYKILTRLYTLNYGNDNRNELELKVTRKERVKQKSPRLVGVS